jgi:hypothetical protein
MIPFLAALPSEPQAEPEQKSETIIKGPSTLTAKPLTLTTDVKPTFKALFEAGPEAKPNSFYVLEIRTGPISYTGRFSIKLFVNMPDANSKTSIKDPHYIGRIQALDSDGRSSEGKDASHRFFVILGRDDSNFYKIVHPGENFKLTLIPSAVEGFEITVKAVILTTIK